MYRTFKPGLFWPFRTWISSGYNGKAKSIQYLQNIVFHSIWCTFSWKEKLVFVFVESITLSVLVEITQYIFALGWREVDDMISNTIGEMVVIVVML